MLKLGRQSLEVDAVLFGEPNMLLQLFDQPSLLLVVRPKHITVQPIQVLQRPMQLLFVEGEVMGHQSCKQLVVDQAQLSYSSIAVVELWVVEQPASLAGLGLLELQRANIAAEYLF